MLKTILEPNPDNFTGDDADFMADFAMLCTFGATANGGVDRLAASAADGQQRTWFTQLLTGHGFTVEFDRIGNQFGTYELVPGAPYVLVGSHLDSQPTAGRYDGAYGVLAAAHAAFRVVAAYKNSGRLPKYNIAVVNWFNEEGSRFKPSMMGSAVYTNKLELDQTLSTQDRDGVTVAEALTAIGCLGAGAGPKAACCAEIHIEQGRSMERGGITIGIVDSNWAANKYEFIVNGEQAHTGSTVIADRKDALLGASMLVVAARELADSFPGVLHTSVGQLDVYPNSPVVVPSRVTLLLDLRSADEDVLAQADLQLHGHIEKIERLANVTIVKEDSHCWPVTPYQPAGVELAEKAAANLGLPHQRVKTLAGHDSTNMKDIVPTVMLFVPSVDGISHNEHEYTRDEDIVSGVHMLTDVVGRLAEGELN
ncbi:M20 family metallo-hydrolase [Arthrobacter psychrochitiniphilus]|uniref:Zn-dependent hydrolase n=1 Tax=Arthrobacter psychrochitiniphilus TaxID=291045 RepID=A0A2V3DQR6_9MICC|nr:M20 family metallo-hydrolase [Arthrobacter psychrochitiniphilus]NYG16122.1 N-carbamoyl-L-amino-acid hydrolase [Arthrobacter psychrochitiniphilus]PXA64484.1 Zn-dependent hydrolase [Arthrobacter psychrochitiniphilus]